ncbi:MAG TPA: DUF1127 domain-containing protein [Aliidongia sp.]|uniref:DUF1127 domain-containing protein n=1 Tax=Aliidongia sp. TaxID=1914230 RepID=UPI002DDCBB7F|nr:DUF1127 domain-containing protein [Aliidongia sp.]HEV2676678.1 DUF1127 domain-containing protein [Aliidongia sp.]
MFTILSAAVRGFRVWQERQRVLNELYSMDDRSLADIGLRRADIPFAISPKTDLAVEARPVFANVGHVAANNSVKQRAA